MDDQNGTYWLAQNLCFYIAPPLHQSPMPYPVCYSKTTWSIHLMAWRLWKSIQHAYNLYCESTNHSILDRTDVAWNTNFDWQYQVLWSGSWQERLLVVLPRVPWWNHPRAKGDLGKSAMEWMDRTVHDKVQIFSHPVFPHSLELESRLSPEMDVAFMIRLLTCLHCEKWTYGYLASLWLLDYKVTCNIIE